MADSSAQTVLVVVGDPKRAELLFQALRHPSLDAQVTTNEQEVLACLKQHRFALAVVGGYIGRRDALVMCEAVRVRQPGLRVLVLLGTEIGPDALVAHRERKLDGVSYCDLGPVWDQAVNRPTVDVADLIRREVLDTLGLNEAPEAHESWMRGTEAALTAEEQREATVVMPMPAAKEQRTPASMQAAPTVNQVVQAMSEAPTRWYPCPRPPRRRPAFSRRPTSSRMTTSPLPRAWPSRPVAPISAHPLFRPSRRRTPVPPSVRS